MIRAAAVLLVLAGCAAPVPPGVFRDAGAPIWSAATLDPARLAGGWRQVATFAPPGAAPCAGATLAFGPGARDVQGALCGGGPARRVAGAVALTGPGRLAVAGEAAPWWVLWLDADGRTLVLGTPDGSFGAVFDRGAIPPDRLAAARDVLAWNGYDMARFTALR